MLLLLHLTQSVTRFGTQFVQDHFPSLFDAENKSLAGRVATAILFPLAKARPSWWTASLSPCRAASSNKWRENRGGGGGHSGGRGSQEGKGILSADRAQIHFIFTTVLTSGRFENARISSQCHFFFHYFKDLSLLALIRWDIVFSDRWPSNMIADSRSAFAQKNIVRYAFPANLPSVNFHLSHFAYNRHLRQQTSGITIFSFPQSDLIV